MFKVISWYLCTWINSFYSLLKRINPIWVTVPTGGPPEVKNVLRLAWNLDQKSFLVRKIKNDKVFGKLWPPGGPFWGQRSILGHFEGQKGKKSRFFDFHKKFNRKAFWCGKFKNDKIFGKFWPPGGHFGGSKVNFRAFWGSKRSKIYVLRFS